MKSFVMPAARKPQTEGFNPFEVQMLNDVNVKQSKKDESRHFLSGLDESGTLRIMMADELSFLCQQIREEHEPIVRARLPRNAKPQDVEAALIEEVSAFIPCTNEAGYVPVEGDTCVWANNPIGRSESGLIVK